jgi:hypothetical protein
MAASGAVLAFVFLKKVENRGSKIIESPKQPYLKKVG